MAFKKFEKKKEEIKKVPENENVIYDANETLAYEVKAPTDKKK